MQFKHTFLQWFDKDSNPHLFQKYSAISMLIGLPSKMTFPGLEDLEQEMQKCPAGTQWEITFRKIDPPKKNENLAKINRDCEAKADEWSNEYRFEEDEWSNEYR